MLGPWAAFLWQFSLSMCMCSGTDNSRVVLSSSLSPGISSGRKASAREEGGLRAQRKVKQMIKGKKMADETKNRPFGSCKGNSFDRGLFLSSRVVCCVTDDTGTSSPYLCCQFN